MITRSELLKHFHAECRKRYLPLGFRRKKNGYWRIVGDILQTFSLQFSRDGRNGRICFGVYPLCMSPKFVVDVGLYVLGQFDAKTIHWSFDKTLYSNSEECLKATFSMIDVNLIPFFEKAIDCQSAFAESIRLDFLFDSIRKQHLNEIGGVDRAEPIETRSYYDGSKFYMALKLHDYEWAQKHICLHLQATESAYQRAVLMETDDEQWKNAYCQRLLNAVDGYRRQLRYLNPNHSQMIDDHLMEQEQLTRLRLMPNSKR